MKRAFMILSVILALSVSGCVTQDFFQGLMGQTGPTVEQSPDIIVLENIGTIPMGSVRAGTQFTAYFDLKNQGEVGSPALKNVIVKLYNWGECAPTIDSFQPAGWSTSSPSYTDYDFLELVPNQVERIEMQFNAPASSAIGFMEADCPVDWQVSYKFNARSNDDFTIISNERLTQLQRAGQSWQGSDLPQYVGIGPIKLYFSFKTPMPVREGNSIQFSVQVADKGMGTYPNVTAGTLFIKVPSDWTGATATPCGDKFNLVGTEGQYSIYSNNKDINLINRNTPELICEFKAPPMPTIPEKSYTVYANVTDYTYVTYGNVDVHIVP